MAALSARAQAEPSDVEEACRCRAKPGYGASARTVHYIEI